MDALRFGRSIRALRARRGWRQQDLADAAGLSRSAIGRIEQGLIAGIPWSDLQSVAKALEGRLGLDFTWRGGDLDRLLDSGHAAVVEALVRTYAASGWQVVVEATFSEFGERGSIDVFCWHTATGAVAVNEVKATVAEAGRTVMGVDRKARLAPIVAKKLGWTCRTVSRFLVIADGPTSRRRVREHAAMFRAAFPLGTRECRDWISRPSTAMAGLMFIPNAHGKGATRALSPSCRVRRRQPRTSRPG